MTEGQSVDISYDRSNNDIRIGDHERSKPRISGITKFEALYSGGGELSRKVTNQTKHTA